MKGKILVPVTANSTIVPIKCDDLLSLNIAVWGTFGSATAVFEVSYNSTNGTDGIWFPTFAVRSNGAATQESGFTSLVNTPNYFWFFSIGGAEYFRVRFTAFTSGTCNVALCPHTGSTQYPLNTTIGPVAHDAVTSGNPVRGAGKSATTMPAAVSAAGDTCDFVTTMNGAQVVSPFSTPDSRIRGSAALTLTSDVAVIASAGAGLRNNISDIVAINTGTAVDLIVKDGSTEIFRITLPQNVPVSISLNSPLRGTAATAVNCALSAAGTVRVNLMGFIG